MPGYRVSEGKWLEILEPGALVNLPIEVDVYDGASPATMLATIETAQEAALQVQLSEVGAGRFAIDRAHPKATPDILARGNLVKIKTGGVYRGAFWIEEPEEILTSTQEAAGELVKVAGRGSLAYIEQAVVYPPVWPVQPGEFVSASHGANAEAGATTISISKPAGLTSGDVMIAAIAFVGGSSKTINPPLGWKEFRRVNYGTTIGTSYFRKAATTSEPSSYQWAFTSTTGAVGNIVALRNVTPDQTQYGFAATSQGSGTAITNPSVDVPIVDGVLLTFSTATAGTGMTPPAGMTEATDDAQRTNRVMESAYLVGPALGETGDLVATNSTSAAWIGSTLFIPSTASLDVEFGGDTPGAILATLIDRAQARGALPDLSYDFSSTVDSQGQPWPDTHELTFHAGTTLLDVFRQLVALGVEGEMTHDLKLSLYVNRSRDRTGDVILRKGYHLLGSVSNLAHLSGLRTRLLVEGAGGRVIEVGPGSMEANPKIGRREGFLSMATSDAATDLSRAGEKSLELGELEDQARAVPIAHGLLTDGHYEPWEDYRTGDYIGLDAAGTGEYTQERVIGITIAQAGPLDYSVTLNLNSLYLEAAIRMRRELDALAGTGARSSGSSSLGLGGGGGTGGGVSSGLVAAIAGDVAGYLYDKIDVSTKLAKALGGVSGNRVVELDVDVPALGTGTPDGSRFLRDDGAWATPPGASVPASVTVVGANTASGASPLTLTKPTGVQLGDLLMIAAQFTNSVPNAAGPDGGGWTELLRFDTSSNEWQTIYVKVAGASEPASYSFTHSVGTDVAAAIVAYRGIDTLFSSAPNVDRLDTLPIAGTADAWQVCVWMDTTSGSDLTKPAAMTQDVFIRAAGGNTPQVLIASVGSAAPYAAVPAQIATGGATSGAYHLAWVGIFTP